MRLTRRGWVVGGVVLAGLLMAWGFGARSLNAVVAPALVALGAGVVQVWRAPAPTATRSTPAPGFPGERRTVDLAVEGSLRGAVRDAGTDGLRLEDPTGALWGTGDLRYAVELRDRGEQELGPARVTVRDVLGLVAARYDVAGTTPVVVYPDVRPVAATRVFDRLVDESGTRERQAFDRLREYVPGDALRDVHWKSSAKRADDELVVTEFADEDRGGVTIAAEAGVGGADAMAAAAASVAVHLLDAGVTVAVACPSGTVRSATDDDGRERVLGLLARTRDGRVDTDLRATADVHVVAGDDGVEVTVDGDRFDFAALVAPDTPVDHAAGEVVA